MFESNQHIIRRGRPGIAKRLPDALEPSVVAQQQLSVVDIWRTLVKRKVPILLFAGVIFCLVTAYTFLKTPLYEGVARLQIDPTRSSSLGLDADEKPVQTDVDSRVKTEVEIIESDTVAAQVMKSLRLYANPTFAGTDAARGSSADFSQLPPSQRLRLLSRFSDDLVVKVIPNTQVVEIRFRSSDPTLAASTANSIIDEYMQRNFHTRVDSTMQVSQWLSGQMEEIRANTMAAQQKLADFQQKANLLGTDESDNIVTDRLKELNDELTEAEADRIVKEGRYRLARSGNPELVASAIPDTTLQVLRKQQADVQAQYAQLSAKFGSGYPKLRELHSQLTSIGSEIDTEGQNIEIRLANDYGAAAKTEAMIRDEFEKQKTEAYKLNEHVAQYSILKHEVESGQQLYDTLQLKLKEADVTSGLTSSYISVVDRAQPPDKPFEPKKASNLALGLGGGLFGGLLLGLVLDSFDDTVETSEEVEAVVALPELGSVPYLAALVDKKCRQTKAANLKGLDSGFSPISIREPQCPGAEAYRSLCSMILLSSVDDPTKVLVVTSAMPSEGKSTISSNLATTLAQRGKRVLLLDADLRCSSIHGQLGKVAGLSTILASGSSPCLQYQPLADLPNLRVVPAGSRPTAPTEILASARLQQLMEVWRDEYDHVIIDTPPVLPFADALILSAFADGVILVTRSEVSRNKALLRARDVLSRSRAQILGFVLNSVRHPEYYYAYRAEYKLLSGYQKTPADRKKAKAAGAS